MGTTAPRAAEAAPLPERDVVHWRRPVDDAELRRRAGWWSLTTVAHAVPFVLAAGLLIAVKPVLTPVALVLIAHAWAIPELYANRGANVLRPRPPVGTGPERRALLLLGDLIDQRSRELHARTGLVLAPGTLGVWIVGEAGVMLIRPGGHRVNCYCVKATGTDLPRADRIAHLLLALRCDESGFATVANLAFSGATWRIRRRLPAEQRPALAAARQCTRRRWAESLKSVYAK